MGSKTCQELVSEVIKRDLCTLCGASVGWCPYSIEHNGQILLRDICDLPQGRCSIYYPRISLDLEKLSENIFKIPYTWEGIGAVKAIFVARTTNTKIKALAQDAGTVMTLFCFAKDEGLIDSAILTLFEDKSLPRGMVASTRDEILAFAGLSYMTTPTVKVFNRSV